MMCLVQMSVNLETVDTCFSLQVTLSTIDHQSEFISTITGSYYICSLCYSELMYFIQRFGMFRTFDTPPYLCSYISLTNLKIAFLYSARVHLQESYTVLCVQQARSIGENAN